MAKAKKKLPLFFHKGGGQWCKKINGKHYYFGTEYEAALDRYLNEKDGLKAGRKREQKPDAATVVELANLYAEWYKRRVASKKVTQRSLDESTKTIKRLIAIRGTDSRPATWSPLDFDEIKEAFFAPVIRTVEIRGGIKGPAVDRRSPSTVDGDIRRIKAFLFWCADCELMPAPRFGKMFDQSSITEQRIAKIDSGKRDLTPDAIKAILASCSLHMKPLVLLGINGGFGAKDLAELKLSDYTGEWIDYARRKTGVERKVWLWPETRAAIDSYMKKRRNPYSESLEQVLFLTAQRQPWMRGEHDAVGKAFQKAREAAELDRGTFYDLRRTFQTVAEGCLDFPAVSHVMGHAAGSDDMSAKYRQRITDERIKAVCEHVRTWLFG